MNSDASPPKASASALSVLRHLVATLAYRAAKVLRDVSPEFASAPLGSGRRPVQIVAHMGDLMDWAISLAKGGYVWKPNGSGDWEREANRFFAALEALDRELASAGERAGETGAATVSDSAVEKLIQRPLADALTHVGQLAMLRGIAGAPIRPESYAQANIVRGRVGIVQTSPAAEFDGDASAKG
jgi:hypothetical protein